MKFSNIARVLSVLTLVLGWGYTPANSQEQKEAVQKIIESQPD